MNGVKFDNTLADQYRINLQETEMKEGNVAEIQVQVSSNPGKLKRLHYSSIIKLAHEPLEGPINDFVDLKNTHNLSGSTYYNDGTLFHGPKFQGIQKVLEYKRTRFDSGVYASRNICDRTRPFCNR